MTKSVLEWGLLWSIFLAIYPTVGYPLALALLGLFRSRPIRRSPIRPFVSILIPAYNESACIAATIENKLQQDYPAERTEIIVVSDASDDGTDAIVASYASRGVKLIRRERREGKAIALNVGVSVAVGDVIVFSDANSQFATDAVRLMIENFADPDIGYVTGRLQYVHEGGASGRGSGAYMRYENWLRRLETRVGSVIGVNGGVGAMKRNLYRAVPKHQMTDFVLPLSVIARGSRVVFDERVQSKERANSEMQTEFRMRIRVALRALYGLVYVKAALNPLKQPLAAFCIVSHKVLRYFCFVFLATTFAFNVALVSHARVFEMLLAFQVLFYALAIAGLSSRAPRGLRALTAVSAYFVMSNLAFGIAVFRLVRGDTLATWKPRAG